MPPAAERLGSLAIDDQLESGPRSNFALGQSVPKWGVRATSAFPTIATAEPTSQHVSSVAISDIARRPSGGLPLSFAESSLPVNILTKCILLNARVPRLPTSIRRLSLQLLLRGHCCGRR